MPNRSVRTEEAPQRVARSGASDMSEDVLKSNTRAGPNENTDYRSMCDSLIGNGSAKWQAQQWPGATSLNSGSFSEQMPCAIGQRVWKRQPVGGSSGDGGSPARMMRLRVFWISGSGTGTADSSDCVYGW